LGFLNSFESIRPSEMKVVEMVRPTTETVVVPSYSHAQQVSYGK